MLLGTSLAAVRYKMRRMEARDDLGTGMALGRVVSCAVFRGDGAPMGRAFSAQVIGCPPTWGFAQAGMERAVGPEGTSYTSGKGSERVLLCSRVFSGERWKVLDE